MLSDIEIAQAARLTPNEFEPYGRDKAKLSLTRLARGQR